MANPQDLPANQRPPRMDIGDHPGLGFVPPPNCEVAALQPPAATDPAYTKAYEAQREAAWDLYRRGGSGSVAFPWVRTQTGEAGRWVLEVGWAQSEAHGWATIIRVVEAGNPFDLPPGATPVDTGPERTGSVRFLPGPRRRVDLWVGRPSSGSRYLVATKGPPSWTSRGGAGPPGAAPARAESSLATRGARLKGGIVQKQPNKGVFLTTTGSLGLDPFSKNSRKCPPTHLDPDQKKIHSPPGR